MLSRNIFAFNQDLIEEVTLVGQVHADLHAYCLQVFFCFTISQIRKCSFNVVVTFVFQFAFHEKKTHQIDEFF